MRIAFVEDILRFSIPLGITMVSGSLRDRGHEVTVYVVDKDIGKTLRQLEQYKPDAVALSVLTGSHVGYQEIARAIKQLLNIPIIWGGPHATFFPEVIELDCADAVCIGEGEEAAVEFADAFDAAGKTLPIDTPNFWVKRDGVIHRNAVRPRNRSLDDLPYPARDLYYDQFPILKNHGIKHFLAHRGCPYKCTYCFNHSFNQIYLDQAGDKKVFHSRTPDSIVDEILWLQNQVPIKMVTFVDDVFTLHRKWTLEFSKVYQKRCGIPFSINTRFDNVDEEIVSSLAKAGLHLVYAGVEAGSEHIRNSLMERNMSIESMLEAGNLYKKYGIRLLTENVLGNPGETFEMALETLRINIKLKPDIANASVFAPYPGLKMTQIAIDGGYFDGDFDRLESNYYHGSALRFDKKGDQQKILNLRCFFSLFTHQPWLMTPIIPLLRLPFNTVFQWVGDITDGYYLRKGMAYKQGLKEFFTTVRHFLTNYRGPSGMSRSASNKQTGLSP
jgi:radical SAM superfamily enzyme YgiQ (UPF0313 family)